MKVVSHWLTLAATILLASAIVFPLGAQKKHPQPFNSSTLTTIALGSCNKQDKPQPLWNVIMQHQPDLWIWLGDNIYGDSNDMNVLKAKYEQQLKNIDYEAFIKKTPLIGIWDDHDYGANDAGKEYPHKNESQKLMLDFLGVPANAPQRQREGTYAAYTFGKKDKQVKIILLDTRYFRDSLVRIDKVYQVNATGTILGEAQWKWLEEELKNSTAAIHIIGSSIQTLSEEHAYEKWANFPKDRARLLKMLEDLKIKNPILLSGDRHIGELSRWQSEGGYQLYDLTSSGLTHSWDRLVHEENKHRISPLVKELNFGIIQIDWKNKEMTLELRGKEDTLFHSEKIAID